MWYRIHLLLFLMSSLLLAEKSVYSDANRSLYTSPRSRAMGGADLSLSSEPLPSGSPAGIIRLDESSLYLGYTGLYQNLFSATSAYFTHPLDSIQSVGASVSYMMIPDVDSVSAEDLGEGVPSDVTINSITSSELYINLMYGRKLLTFSKGYLSAGGAIHMKRIRLDKRTGYGVGADLGFLSNFDNGASVALKMENFFTEYTHWSERYQENGLPKFFLGAGWERDVSEKIGLSFAYRSPDLFGNSGVTGGKFTEDGQFEDEPESGSVKSNPKLLVTYANWGSEIRIQKIVAFRVGFTDTRMLNFGGGVHLFDKWDIDFVYSHSNALESSYSLSTRVLF